MRDDFAVFILSHGRPHNIKTLKALERGNYHGKVYIVIDDEDPTGYEYHDKYGDRVIEFSKKEIAKRFDTADLSRDMRTIVYARNAAFDIAEALGLEYFLELDDDYSGFGHRYVSNGKLSEARILELDAVFEAMIDFLEDSGALTVAFAQGGDFIGGADSRNFRQRLLRKAMNTFFCKTSRRFDFVGRVNEDVNTYTSLGSRGGLFLTVCDVSIGQATTQSQAGGMTGTYLDSGTYVKSFYSVMMMPSAVKIDSMGDSHQRLHHRIKWDNCVPKILSDVWRRQ